MTKPQKLAVKKGSEESRLKIKKGSGSKKPDQKKEGWKWGENETNQKWKRRGETERMNPRPKNEEGGAVIKPKEEKPK